MSGREQGVSRILKRCLFRRDETNSIANEMRSRVVLAGAVLALMSACGGGRGVQKLCQSPRIQFINSMHRRLDFAGFQGLISRDRLCAARQANRARLTSTRRIWYSRARVKPVPAYPVRRIEDRPGRRAYHVGGTWIDRLSGRVFVFVEQAAE